MAILRRHKSTVYGLQTDLDNLGTADTTEAGLRAQGDLNLQNNIDAESTTRTTEVGLINGTLGTHTSEISTLETQMGVVQGDAATAGSIAKAQSDSQAYTDTRETAITSALQTYADTAESDAISTSNSYTDTRESAITSAYQTYANQAEADAISTAQSYTNTREASITSAYESYADQSEVDAKAYTDVRETAITSAYRTYADTAEADAISSAQSYTDGRETAITSAYQTYADTAESDAVSSANGYTDGEVVTLNAAIATKLTIASNLSDVGSVSTARTNLGVYSSTEVDTAINDAKLALGTNYSVADATAKDALTDLTVGDNVFVTDDGDAKWANYKVTAITDGAGSTSTFEKIMDQDIYLNSISASAIKTAYESNDDTNAFTDAEKNSVATSASSITTITGDAATNGSFAFADAAVLSSANGYTDTRESAITTAYQTYADTAESDAVSSANGYTDTRESAITTALQSYADTAEADAISTSNTYTDGRETAITSAYQSYADQAETDAKGYTDTRETVITSAYQTYADTAEADAISTSNTYTDGRETAITTAYQSYADQAETDAISSAGTYTDGQISTVNASIATKLSIASNLSDVNNAATARTNLGVYSTSEVDSAVSSATASMLAVKAESLVVSGDLVTLSEEPADGVILNFGTVRYVDENGNSFDVPVSVTATAGGKEFELNGDSANQFDTKTVQIQYMYIA